MNRRQRILRRAVCGQEKRKRRLRRRLVRNFWKTIKSLKRDPKNPNYLILKHVGPLEQITMRIVESGGDP